jgi:hypothetical protein
MKNNRIGMRIIILLYIASTLFMAGESFAASEKSKISITVKPKSEKSDDERDDLTESGSTTTETFVKTEFETVTLTAKIKNSEDQAVTGQLAWLFISDFSSGKTNDRAPVKSVTASFSPGKKEVTLEPGSVLEETILSKPFMYEEKTVNRESDTSSSTTDTEKGNVYKGYLVLFIVDGETVAMSSNSSRYKKDEWIEKCRNAK